MNEMERRGKNAGKKTKIRGTPLSDAQREYLKNRRLERAISLERLAELTGLTVKWHQNVESWHRYHKPFDPDAIAKTLNALEIDHNAFFSMDEHNGVRQHNESMESATRNIFDFIELPITTAQEIDSHIIPIIKDHKNAPEKLLLEDYKAQLHYHFHNRNSTLDSFREQFLQSLYSITPERHLPEPSLTIDIAPDFSGIVYSIPQGESLEVQNPTLLWDCHCKTPNKTHSKDSCPIHSQPIGDEITARFRGGLIQFRFDGLTFFWRRGAELWPPSVDSIFMIQDLKGEGIYEDEIQTVLDMGSGTGFLGIHLACRNPHVVKVDLSDWLLTPYIYGSLNWWVNAQGLTHKKVEAKVGLFYDELSEISDLYDVVLCNPPYLPLLPGFEDMALQSTVSGTDLLVKAILDAERRGKRTYLQFSDLALPEARQAALDAGVKLVEIPTLKPRFVPFRVYFVWDRPKYLEVLIKERGLKHRKNHRHPYWHRLNTYRIDA